MRVFRSNFKFFNFHKLIRGISSCLIFIFFTLSSLIAFGQNSLQNGLVAWYPFEGNASDMSGNGNHGTVNGATLGTDRHGQVNRSYIFDGIDDNIVIQEINSFEAQKHTLSVWVFAQQWHGDIMSKDGEASQRQWLIGSAPANGEIIAHVWTSSSFYQGKSIFSLKPNQWNNIIQIWNSSSLALYINGFLQSETQTFGSLALGDQPIRIGGGAPESFPLWFNGSIDDIRIYDRALSAEEIRLLYDTETELPSGAVNSTKLSTALSDLIDGNGALEQALPAGSVIARKPGDAPPPGYTLFQRPEYNASLVWEEKASISIARFAFDGAEVMDGEIYFTGMQLDHNRTGSTLLERYDPSTDTWENLTPRPKVRYASCSTVLNGKYYAMGGRIGDGSVEIYDPETNSWSEGVPMPVLVDHCGAITYEGKIYVVGNNQVIVFDPSKNKWELKAECGLSSWGTALALYQNRIWSFTQQGVESYDPHTDTWQTEASPSVNREFGTAWVYQDKLYFACGRIANGSRFSLIETYSPKSREWVTLGEFTDKRSVLDSVVINDRVYLVGGAKTGLFLNSMYSAKLPLVPPMNLYFKEGNATMEAELSTLGMADGSVTLGQLAPDTLAKFGLDHNPATAEGSLLAVPRGEQPPPGYALYKRSDRNGSLVWEEKAPVSLGRDAKDGVEVIGEKLYFVGGGGYISSESKKITESYDPKTNAWTNLQSLPNSLQTPASASLGGKLYAIGGNGVTHLQIYDPIANTWTLDSSLSDLSLSPNGSAITVQNKLYYIDGNESGFSRMFVYDPNSDDWSQRSSMLQGRTGFKLVWFKKRIWAIGGWKSNIVESYDISTNTWRTETSLPEIRGGHVAWVAQNKIFILGRWGGATDEIIAYNPITSTWSYHSQFPTIIGCAGSAILDGKVYVVAGRTSITDDQNHSNRVFAADITPPMDLYYRENSAGGSLTLGKLSEDVVGRLNQSKTVSLPAGMVTSVDYNGNASNKYSILERTDRNATHQWEEMAPAPISAQIYDGIEIVNNKIYLVGGYNGSALNSLFRYDPVTNAWETLANMQEARAGVSTAALGDKIYAISGHNAGYHHLTVEVYDTKSNQWTDGPAIAQMIRQGAAISIDGRLFVMGGINPQDSENSYNLVWELNDQGTQWIARSPMPVGKHGIRLQAFDGKIWVYSSHQLQVYDVANDSWEVRSGPMVSQHYPIFWRENNSLFMGGGLTADSYKVNTERLDLNFSEWRNSNNLPEPKYVGGSVVLLGKVYIFGGRTTSENYSNKLFAADLLPSRDLYFRSHDSLIPNNPPTNLNSNGPLIISENQPIGTVVGSFAASDPEGRSLSFVTYPSPPADLNPELWLDASSFQNPDLLAGKVRTWTDLSAGSKQANQLEVSRMPTFDKVKRGIFFDGADDFLDVPGFNPSGAMSVYIVFSNLRSEQDLLEINSTDPLISTMLSGHQNPGFSLSSFNSWSSSYREPLIGGSQSFPGDTRTNGLEFSGVLDYGKTYLFSSELTPSQGMGPFRIGSYLNGQHFGRNRINEIIILSGHSSENLRNQIEKYLLGKWEIQNQINQSLFTLESNGTLRTGTVFDYETFSQNSIRVEVRDEHNASMVKDFVVQIADDPSDNQTDENEEVPNTVPDDPPKDDTIDVPLDDGTKPVTEIKSEEQIGKDSTKKEHMVKAVALRPVPFTHNVQKIANGGFRLHGQILYDGGSVVEQVGFVFGTSIRLNNADRVIAASEGENFYYLHEGLEAGRTYYFRAFAKNIAGETMGSLRKVKVHEDFNRNTWYGKMESLGNGWWRSEWMGVFSVHTNGWIYHTDLGWAYAEGDKQEGVWLWTRKRGWLWTAERAWPYLWQHEAGNWFYFLKQEGKAGVFFDFSSGQYTE